MEQKAFGFSDLEMLETAGSQTIDFAFPLEKSEETARNGK